MNEVTRVYTPLSPEFQKWKMVFFFFLLDVICSVEYAVHLHLSNPRIC